MLTIGKVRVKDVGSTYIIRERIKRVTIRAWLNFKDALDGQYELWWELVMVLAVHGSRTEASFQTRRVCGGTDGAHQPM